MINRIDGIKKAKSSTADKGGRMTNKGLINMSPKIPKGREGRREKPLRYDSLIFIPKKKGECFEGRNAMNSGGEISAIKKI